VARVKLAAAAAEDLDRLIVTHTLPADTKERVQRTLRPLERFPLLGPQLRFVLGPWRWMVIVYAYLEDEDLVVIVTIQDGRSSSAAGAPA